MATRTFWALGHLESSTITVFVKKFLQTLIVHFVAKVLDVDVGKLLRLGSEFSLSLFARLETTHKPDGRGDAQSLKAVRTELKKRN